MVDEFILPANRQLSPANCLCISCHQSAATCQLSPKCGAKIGFYRDFKNRFLTLGGNIVK
jgi:hypothetical protein